jgi:hypothetical protein
LCEHFTAGLDFLESGDHLKERSVIRTRLAAGKSLDQWRNAKTMERGHTFFSPPNLSRMPPSSKLNVASNHDVYPQETACQRERTQLSKAAHHRPRRSIDTLRMPVPPLAVYILDKPAGFARPAYMTLDIR